MRHRGIVKVVEEAGEVVCEVAKLTAYPDQEHPDGRGNTRNRVLAEMSDLHAAVTFYVVENATAEELVEFHRRVEKKVERFRAWNETTPMAGISE